MQFFHSPIQKALDRYASLQSSYPYLGSALFFLLGFLFDLLTVTRIDDKITIFQQGIYLVVIAYFLYLELLYLKNPVDFTPIAFKKLWKYREEIIHFLFGSLLSIYSLFYLKSSSSLHGLLFISFLFILLIANEFPYFRKLGLKLRFAIFSLSVCSYTSFLVPILFGTIGIIEFSCSIFVAVLFLLLIWFLIRKKISDKKIILTQMLLPSISMQCVFVLMYFLAIIPPVPLSVQKMGVYHKIVRKDSTYELYHEKPWWKFWENGDQRFYARPGDTVYLFVRIFSPVSFSHRIKIQWQKKEKNKWILQDTIPIAIKGGREKGYRGIAQKRNYSEGNWRVLVTTSNNREISRIYFSILLRPEKRIKKLQKEIE